MESSRDQAESSSEQTRSSPSNRERRNAGELRKKKSQIRNSSSEHPQTIHAEQEREKKWRMPFQFIKYGEQQRSGGIIFGANKIIA
ncbi:hypothetical protein CDAR_167511 [Caerostris darwini]|uniref:Uncharacterized protein n=1 Tax=Caerostris darwini TaxID=1538125 RepID=A0AAV4NIG1_9ARAC|nr:hypothetical protein CDAR_167511 [Caerostris darwini]